MTAHLDLATLSVRARGLGTHLLDRSALEELATSDSGSFVRALARTRAVPGGLTQSASLADAQAAIRRTAMHHLRRIEPWVGNAGALDLFYAEQERRTLRALLRGAIEGASPEVRLAAALPTPRLPDRALRELALQPTAAKVALHLLALGHPDASRLLPIANDAQPVLFDLDVALLRGFAERVRSAARTGDPNLVSWARGRIDTANAETALALAGGASELDPATCFVEGGETLAKDAFVQASRARTRTQAATLLARAMRAGVVTDALRASEGDSTRFETEMLARSLADQRRRARVDPLGSAPVVLFLLRLEAQSRDLLRLSWGASLGVSPSSSAANLVTPWS